MNKSLTRSIGFWLLLVLALAATALGGWLISDQLGTMTANLLDNTATGVDVYVGQSLVVVGAAFLGAGILGILLAVALLAVQSLQPSATPAAAEFIGGTAEHDDTIVPGHDASVPVDEEEPSVQTGLDSRANAVEADAETDRSDDQKGSSGSTATATKISVK